MYVIYLHAFMIHTLGNFGVLTLITEFGSDKSQDGDLQNSLTTVSHPCGVCHCISHVTNAVKSECSCSAPWTPMRGVDFVTLTPHADFF